MGEIEWLVKRSERERGYGEEVENWKRRCAGKEDVELYRSSADLAEVVVSLTKQISRFRVGS